jgi:hypothetical protein
MGGELLGVMPWPWDVIEWFRLALALSGVVLLVGYIRTRPPTL